MPVYKTKSEKETREIALEFAKNLKAGDVIAFVGGMGAGKTTFTRGLVEGLGIADQVSSPTFAIVNEYQGNGIKFYHFDMYRVLDFDSLYSTGFFDYLDREDGIIAVEWSENISDELPENSIFITIALDSENPNNRTIEIKGGKF